MQVDPMSERIADVIDEYIDRVNVVEMECALLDEPVERADLRSRLTATTKAALAALKQKAMADNEKAKASERAKARLEKMAFLKQQGLEYLDTAGSVKDPEEKLVAAKTALAFFAEYNTVSAVRAEVNEKISQAQRLAAAAQEELDVEKEYVVV